MNIDGIPHQVVERYRLDRIPFGREQRSTADLLSLAGKTAIVTGGGGSGLGNCTAHRLAEQGARVAVFDVSRELAKTAADELMERWGVPALAVVADVGDLASIELGVSAVLEAWGQIDILVNNAGGSGSIKADGAKVEHHGSFLSLSLEDLQGVVRVNFMGVLNMCRAVLPVMVERGVGRIVNVSSEGGKTTVDDLAVYNASKSGVIGFTRNLARDVGGLGIGVVGVCPGIMVSERTLNTLSTAVNGIASLDSSFPRVSIDRMSLADEVASVISFLASDAGAYVNGTSVSAGGGLAD
ncbi:SDR family NAD(P)-dependent oxidoreductase [Streptomyces sp. NPDC050625]|uniref:SDR family NAD(P)-dependent oxidoreductase n=1 Tax=Streptomyces sp. NPDC050625 TaxID=3154629 RepID=UPI003412B0F6